MKKKEQIFEKFDETYVKWKELLKRGNWTLQSLCFTGGCANFILAILSFLNFVHIATEPLYYLLNFYVTFFSLIVIVFECPVPVERIINMRRWFEIWFKAFDRLVGRGACYIFLGSFVATSYGWIGYLFGGYIMFCGLSAIFVGLVFLSRRLYKLREELQLAFGNDFERIQNEFNKFDTNNSGYINAQQFAAMSESLGLQLSSEEADLAMKIIDKNCDGVMDIYEFLAWFNSHSSHDYV